MTVIKCLGEHPDGQIQTDKSGMLHAPRPLSPGCAPRLHAHPCRRAVLQSPGLAAAGHDSPRSSHGHARLQGPARPCRPRWRCGWDGRDGNVPFRRNSLAALVHSILWQRLAKKQRLQLKCLGANLHAAGWESSWDEKESLAKIKYNIPQYLQHTQQCWSGPLAQHSTAQPLVGCFYLLLLRW